MKLITEMTEDIQIVTETIDEGKGREHFIEGVFMQSNLKNRNGRVYPREPLMNEVARYNKEYVSKNRAMGELNHPQGPTVNLDRVSHIIKELRPRRYYFRLKILQREFFLRFQLDLNVPS